MNTSNGFRLAEAARHLETALGLLDEAGAPADIGANLAQVLSRLGEHLKSNEVIEFGKKSSNAGE